MLVVGSTRRAPMSARCPTSPPNRWASVRSATSSPSRPSGGCGSRCRCRASATGSGWWRRPSSRGQLETGYSAGLYAIASVLAVRLIPALVIGPFAGAWADRFNRRYTMVTADVLRFGLYASIPIVRTLWWLLVATFLIESLSLFWIPAKEASVPTLVPPSQLESANRLSLVTTYGSAAVASTLFAFSPRSATRSGTGSSTSAATRSTSRCTSTR